jgi:biotin carboxyl carrier protein
MSRPREPLTTRVAGRNGRPQPSGIEPGREPGREPGLPTDPRAVRVGVAPAMRLEGDPAFSLAPPPEPGPGSPPSEPGREPLLDGALVAARLRRHDDVRAVLEVGSGPAVIRTHVLFGPVRLERERGTAIREVVVDGWRIEVEIEPERSAMLRERARQGAGAAARGGPIEVRAIIPGRIVAVFVAPGDAVEAGQQILVVEAMKMQNELRAPREGSVERVGVAVGDTIEVGDLLVVIH